MIKTIFLKYNIKHLYSMDHVLEINFTQGNHCYYLFMVELTFSLQYVGLVNSIRERVILPAPPW